ncbi:DUF5688 family protein [Anaerosporobacter sp.]
MDYELFKNCIVQSLKQQFLNAEIRSNKVRKNNGMELDSLVIHETDNIVVPSIYLNYYYSKYQHGLSVENIIMEICSKYKEFKENSKYMKNENYINHFKDFTTASEHIVFKLVNFEKNKRLLEDVPFTRFLDLAIVYAFLVKEEDNSVATILIRNEHLQMWNITANELHEYAMLKTPKLMPVRLKSMEEVLRELFGQSNENMEGERNSDSNMYILSNGKGIHGASTILYPGVLGNFAHRNNDDIEQLYILPSSIHEVILLPCNQMLNITQLQQMVEEINKTQVPQDEILSDSIYVYSVKDDTIFLADIQEL